MDSDETANLNSPGIAVICNAWKELNKEIHQKSFQITLDIINNNPSIEYVLLAGTHVNLIDENQGSNQWVNRSRQIFVDEQGVDWIRRLWLKTFDENNQTDRSFHHNPLIRDHDYQGRSCIAIWEQWQLEWLLNHYFPHIQNVWYFGAGLGVRRDPFGWGQLCDLIKHNHVKKVNILAHRSGMLNNLCNATEVENCDFEYIEWEKIADWKFISDEIVVKTTLDW
jgi:hypothetical protein